MINKTEAKNKGGCPKKKEDTQQPGGGNERRQCSQTLIMHQQVRSGVVLRSCETHQMARVAKTSKLAEITVEKTNNVEDVVENYTFQRQ